MWLRGSPRLLPCTLHTNIVGIGIAESSPSNGAVGVRRCARCQTGLMFSDPDGARCLNCGHTEAQVVTASPKLPLEDQWLWSSISRATAIKLRREGRSVQQICFTMGRRKNTVEKYLKTAGKE